MNRQHQASAITARSCRSRQHRLNELAAGIGALLLALSGAAQAAPMLGLNLIAQPLSGPHLSISDTNLHALGGPLAFGGSQPTGPLYSFTNALGVRMTDFHIVFSCSTAGPFPACDAQDIQPWNYASDIFELVSNALPTVNGDTLTWTLDFRVANGKPGVEDGQTFALENLGGFPQRAVTATVIASVPEPGILSLVALASAGLMLVRRGRC